MVHAEEQTTLDETWVWDGATFDISSTGQANIYKGPLLQNPIRGNGFSGIYLRGNTEGSSLSIEVSGGDNYKNNQNYNQVYIMGNFRSVSASSESWSSLIVTPENKDNISTEDYSSTNSNGYLNLTLRENAKFYSVLYGGRNDLVGSDDEELVNIGDSCNNSLIITLEKGAILGATLIFGGRSGQAEGVTESDNKSNVNLKRGYLTNNNEVIITGAEGEDNINLNFPAGGIFGAEGWQTNNNYVSLTNAIVSATSINSRKFGIVAGRGLYNFRIDAEENSAISNNNILVIQKSKIATDKASLEAADGKAGMSVLGGYSYGIAKDNITIVEDSEINGHVYGGLELLGITHLTQGAPRRSLNANLVSLHNVKLVGDSVIYGTATADSKTYAEAGSTPLAGVASLNAVDESSLKAVNRRRGIAYIAGSVQAASAYVRFIHFGQSVDVDQINKFESYNIVNSYYPSINSQDSEDQDKRPVPVKNASGEESNRLGQLVGGSYLYSTKGFHSSLSQQDANQSNSTNGDHNFWVASYVNLSHGIDGDGKSLNTKVSLFNGNEVNHNYSDGELSLLALDDGMVLGSSSGDLMNDFRDSYQGRVLYLGVSNGKDYKDNPIRAVAIDFNQIQEFRSLNDQDTKAYGNTQVGVFVDGIGVDGNTTPYQKDPNALGIPRTWENMTFSVPNFSISQNGNEEVALATVGFYKYLHFDGKMTGEDGVELPYYDEKGTDEKSYETIHGKVTEVGEEGGVGLKYWIESLNITGNTLVLYGKDSVSKFADDNENPDTYTLSAYLTGTGGITVPKNTTVIIGDARQPALATNISGTNGIPQEKIGENTYVGETYLHSGAVLKQGTDGALGSEKYYTKNLILVSSDDASSPTSYFLQGHTQTIGGLQVSENSSVDLSTQGGSTVFANGFDGHLTVKGNVDLHGQLRGASMSKLTVSRGTVEVTSQNSDMLGTVALEQTLARLVNQNSLENAQVNVDKNSQLYFVSHLKEANIGGIVNYGQIYLSDGSLRDEDAPVNKINIAKDYEGHQGSALYYRGLVQGDSNSEVDVVRVEGNASGASAVNFTVLPASRGEKTDKGILIFSAKTAGDDQLLTLTEKLRVVDKDDNAYEWLYDLEARDNENGEEGGRNWYLVNERPTEINPDLPFVPDLPEVDPHPLRPEAGAYVAASQSWAKMHMRLHDRFGQAYYIDPFDGEEKPAAAWVRQVGSHSHFRMNGGESKTHSRTAVTQLGGDLIRNELNESWKYIGGIFSGGLYNRADSRSYAKAKSRSDGYAFGAYGTLYTRNSPDDGFYVDTWILYGRYDNKVWGDQRPTFKYKSHGWVWSVETGYTIPLGESGTKDYNKLIWTLQPEAQLVWDGVKANSITDSTGTRYKQLGTNNVVIRAGARFHANYMNKGLGFIEGNWIHNTKKAGVEMGNGRAHVDGGRNLGEFRMGLEGHLTRNTLGWATVGVQAGKSGYHNETAQIGIKYMF